MNNEEGDEEDYGGDIDGAYDRVRDDDSIYLIENIEDLIERLKKTMYYSLDDKRIAKDLIYHILHKMNLKIKDINNITDSYQNINFEEIIKNEQK